jgi:hypothetical protein
MWARMDLGQLFSVFNEWMKRFEYGIELGGERYTKKLFALNASQFAKIERESTTLSHPIFLGLSRSRAPQKGRRRRADDCHRL